MENSKVVTQPDKKLTANTIPVGQNKCPLFLGDTVIGMVHIVTI